MLPNKTILPTILQFVAAVDIAAVESEEVKARPTQETLSTAPPSSSAAAAPLRYSPLTHYHITPLGGQTSERARNQQGRVHPEVAVHALLACCDTFANLP